MSTAIAKNFQVGSDSTATNNFTIRQPATPDGTVRIANGNSGTTTDLVTVTSAGNVGVGVTPSAWNSAVRAIELLSPGSAIYGLFGGTTVTAGAYIDSVGWKYSVSGVPITRYDQGAFASGQHTWFNAASGTAGNAISWTQAMTLTAGGNLGVGTTSPSNRFVVSNSGAAGVEINPSTGNIFTFNRSTLAYTDTTLTANNIIFQSGGATERARITSGGNFGLGTTNPVYRMQVQANATTYAAVFQNQNASPYGLYINHNGASPNNAGNEFIICWDTTATRFRVNSNGGIENYQANNVNLSDRREKTNFAPAGDYLSKICAIPVQTFNYIDQNIEEDPGLTLGVVAQDVQSVAPELVSESNLGTKEDPKMRLSIYQTDLQYALMKCIQELKAELDSVKTELALLKGTA